MLQTSPENSLGTGPRSPARGTEPLSADRPVTSSGGYAAAWSTVLSTNALRLVACPGCGAETARVHGYHERSVADVPIDALRVLVVARIRRLVCPAYGCHQTFREQLPGALERHQP